MGEVTQDDLARWQEGDFSWADWAWCKASPFSLVALVSVIGIPLIALSGSGRLPMHKNVPIVAVQAASVWPCLSEEAQRAANKKAEQYSGTSAPAPKQDEPLIPPVAQETKKQIGLLTVAAVFIGLTILSKRKNRK